MKKLFNLFLVTGLICFGASAYGMKRKNSTTSALANQNHANQLQAARNQIPVVQWFPQEIIAQIAADCWPKEKNILMRVCKCFEVCLKNRKLILRANPAKVGITDKIEDLIKYAREGDLHMTKFLLDHGVDVNFYNCLGIVPFHDAHKNVVPLLIECGAYVRELKPQIHPLHAAVYAGDEETIKTLLASKVDLNIVIANGATSLFIASEKGHTNIVKLLLDACTDKEALSLMVNKAVYYGATPLYRASKYGFTEIVQLLLATDGIEVNKANDEATPLLIASQNGHTEIVKLLLAAEGIDINKANNTGVTPLNIVSQNGYTEIVQLLLAAGANVNKATNDGATPLYIASQNGYTEIVQLLLAAGTDVNKAHEDGYTPLYIASHNGDTEIVKLLLAAEGIKVNKADNNGVTPLFIASEKCYTEIVKLLLKINGIEVNQAANNGVTPLYIASQNGHTEIVELLLAAGANVNKANNVNGVTPLCIASYFGRIEVIQLLLNKGANIHAALPVDVEDLKKGDTPLDIARKKGHTKIVELLKLELQRRETENRLLGIIVSGSYTY